jgi:electron transport complex protein RnfB
LTSDSYERLAGTLNKIPNGFAHIEDGTHLRVLELLFSPDEAELTSRLKLRGETLDELSSRLDIPVQGLEEKLESMAQRGLIRAWTSSSGRRYALRTFIGGIWEEQMKRQTHEFVETVEEFFKKGHGMGVFDTAPPIFKVIPINRAISAELEVYPYEIAERMVENSKSWGIRECACKTHKGMLGEPCKYPTTVCLLLAPNKENAYVDDELTQPISKDRALELLREAEDAGLVHCSMNIRSDHTYICNCCTCCCTMLRGAVEWGQPHAIMKSNYISHVDGDACTGCGTCIDWCQFKALSVPDEICTVDNMRCVGCGVCAAHCPESALHLVSRDPTDRQTPPESYADWMTQKAEFRGVDYDELI